MMRRFVVLGLMSVVMLSGCATPEDRARYAAEAEAQKDAQCRSYGAVPGTDAYVNCRVQIDQTNAQIDAQNAAQQQAVYQQNLNRQTQQMIYGPRSVNCTSTTTGVFTNTSCY